jgi:hypothetical protein
VIRGGAYEGGLMDRSLRGATSHNIIREVWKRTVVKRKNVKR